MHQNPWPNTFQKGKKKAFNELVVNKGTQQIKSAQLAAHFHIVISKTPIQGHMVSIKYEPSCQCPRMPAICV